MSARAGVPIRSILVGLLVLAVAGALALWRGRGSAPSLVEICSLARQRDFDRAEGLLSNYLRVHPDDSRGHLLMAQFSMDRPDPRPEVALEHLGRIRPRTHPEEALIRFSEGKARYQLKEYAAAEGLWKRALELDPRVPEAGWALLDLLDFEGRVKEAHELGMRLFEHEPDPRDRVRLLLEMVRIDVDRIAPGSQVQTFEPSWKQDPSNLPLGVAVGLALVRDSQAERGLEVLREVLERHPDSAEAWDGWLTGLVEGYRPERLDEELRRLPGALRGDPRFAKFEGAVAEGHRDWPRAMAAYRRAYDLEPYDAALLYRLRMSYRALGEGEQVRRADERLGDHKQAVKDVSAVRTEALALPTLGLTPHVDLYHRLASLRERVGRFDEARAWHRLVLRDAPGDATSLAALQRLK
ncbi:tetratricopeptide repeat protein [Aquisphaera insulae]|uniref:tetratricopeptide repeat protein n=1 Tax=Aquisphaera insulae TaxID=2712864 RepID=UPI0013EE1034|nr:tetratricopeptide repeat protein [Aquisphaera insulae]